MKRIVLAGILACLGIVPFCTTLNAAPQNNDTNIYGHVINRRTGEHMPYITVAIVGTTTGTITDATGHYFLHYVPSGEITVEASCIGYKTVERTVSITKDSTVEVNFEMEEAAVDVSAVVITASAAQNKRKEAPSLISVLDTKLFETANATCVAQGLSFQPGVRVEDDCQNCGFTQVRINGLDGHYSQILLDSRPVFSALAGVYGLEQIPANMVDHIEVIRGGGSAITGASAIGGTINIITKEPTSNFAQLGHSITSIGCKGSFDNNTTLNGSIVSKNNKAGIYVYGQNRHRSVYDHDGDGFSELPMLTTQVVGARSYIKLGNYHKLSFQYSGIKEFRRGGDHLDRQPHEAMLTEQTDHTINSGGISFDGSSADSKHHYSVYASMQGTARKSYYGSNMDTNAYGRTTDLTAVTGAQYIYHCPKMFFMPAELTLGAEYNYDDLHDVAQGYGTDTRQRVHIVSGYLQNEWKNDKWGILIGGRLDKHNMISHVIFSPRVNLRYNPVPDVNLRVSYASGFRAPQAFDEDMHISIVGGERVRIRLADNLREEKSHSVSVSADMYHTFGRVQTNLLVEGFYTVLNHTFALRELNEKDEAGNTVKERYNGSGGRVMGVNIEGKVAFAPWVELQLGVTLQQSRYKRAERWSEDEGVAPVRRMFRSPNSYGYLTATVTPVKNFNIAFTGSYTGRMLVQHFAGSGVEKDTAVHTPCFFDLGTKLSYDIKIYKSITLQLFAGVHNIFNSYQRDFDKGYNRDSGYIYGPSLPRSWFVGAKLNF